jgi:hypothetical protein
MFRLAKGVNIKGVSTVRGIEIGSGIIIPKELSKDFLRFIYELATKGWLDTKTVCVGAFVDKSMKLVGILETLDGDFNDENVSHQDEDNETYYYSFDNFVVPEAIKRNDQLVIIKGTDSFAFVEKSGFAEKSCSLAEFTGEQKVTNLSVLLKSSSVPNAPIVREVLAAPVFPAIPSNGAAPLTEFAKLRNTIINQFNEDDKVVFNIVLGGNKELLEKTVTIPKFECSQPSKQKCYKDSDCFSVFCFYHNNYAAHLHNNQERLMEKNPSLKSYISNISKAYACYLKYETGDDSMYDKYIHYLSSAIASIKPFRKNEVLQYGETRFVELL